MKNYHRYSKALQSGYYFCICLVVGLVLTVIVSHRNRSNRTEIVQVKV